MRIPDSGVSRRRKAPPRPPDGHDRIPVRISAGERAEMEAAAEAAGMPLSTWLRETALAAAAARPIDPEPEGSTARPKRP